MKVKELIQSLKNQDLNLNNLLNSLEQQKLAIINNDFNLFETALSEEQKYLRLVEKEEATRMKLIADIIKENNLSNKNYSLAELINNLPKLFEKDLKEIQQLRKTLKDKAERIKAVNSQLKDVIEFSRSLIKETMMIVAQKSKKGIVNKRV
ncbi:MAG: flagellar protein FlgN [Melioribacteraceae bacterium]|nr:flagellar protein FlgN [Melioribacteraceae bacterium]